MNTIGNSQLTSIASLPPVSGLKTEAEPSGSFKNLLIDSIQNVNTMQQQAEQAVESLMTGGEVNPAEVLTAVQKADLTFRLMMQMRNKMMQVYQEVRDIRI